MATASRAATIDDVATSLIEAIEDQELQVRARLGERLILRFRKSRKFDSKNRLVLDLCLPLFPHPSDGLYGGVPERGDPNGVLWNYGSGAISQKRVTLLCLAARQLGWGVDDWALDHV